MSEMSAEKLARRALEVGIIDARAHNALLSEVGGHEAPEKMASAMVRHGFVTNFQLDRLMKGERQGFFYGDYKVLYLIGAGTFARVYRAVHKEDGSIAAVKVLRKRYSEDAEKTEQFLREGELGTKLRHPNIVPIYEVSTDRKKYYLVMEFVEGRNLRDLMKVRKKLEWQEAMQLSIDIASALSYGIEQGVGHRDLKLSNVLVTTKMRAKLVDFGLAAQGMSSASDADIVNNPNPRTIDYAGLERATGVRKDDPRSDIYFAACVFYHVVSGKPPLFETKDRSQRLSVDRYKSIKPLWEVAPDVPKPFAGAIHRALEFAPDKRTPNATVLLHDLKDALARIERGEDTTESAPANQENPDGKVVATKEGADRTVMVIESNAEMQNLLRGKLKKYGYRVLVISNPERALSRFDDGFDQPADCVIFGVHDLGVDAVNAFNRFQKQDHTQDIPSILLLGQGRETLREEVRLDDDHVALSYPIKVKELRKTIHQLLHSEEEE